MNTPGCIAVLIACCLAWSAASACEARPGGRQQLSVENAATAAQSDLAVCAELNGNARAICMEEAKGRAQIAKAQAPDGACSADEHRYHVHIVTARAAHAVAKQRCYDLGARAKDACRLQAYHAYESAKAAAQRTLKLAISDTASTRHDPGWMSQR